MSARRIALTGGIGSGKSAVACLLAELGAAVVSSDDAARAVTAPGTPALAEIARAFGPGVIRADGSLDRRALAAVVFADPVARRRLEAILHPEIRRELERRAVAALASDPPPPAVVFEIPLLFETGRQDEFDEVWVVTAPEETRIARVMARDGLTRQEVLARMGAQLPLEEKARRAHVVIDNGGDWAATARQVRAAWQRVLARTARRDGHG